jgi:hypothetical protein
MTTIDHGFAGAYTEGAIAGKYGYRVLTVVSLMPEGRLGEWHRPTDTVDRIDPSSVEACETFTWEILRGLDQNE